MSVSSANQVLGQIEEQMQQQSPQTSATASIEIPAEILAKLEDEFHHLFRYLGFAKQVNKDKVFVHAKSGGESSSGEKNSSSFEAKPPTTIGSANQEIETSKNFIHNKNQREESAMKEL